MATLGLHFAAVVAEVIESPDIQRPHCVTEIQFQPLFEERLGIRDATSCDVAWRGVETVRPSLVRRRTGRRAVGSMALKVRQDCRVVSSPLDGQGARELRDGRVVVDEGSTCRMAHEVDDVEIRKGSLVVELLDHGVPDIISGAYTLPCSGCHSITAARPSDGRVPREVVRRHKPIALRSVGDRRCIRGKVEVECDNETLAVDIGRQSAEGVVEVSTCPVLKNISATSGRCGLCAVDPVSVGEDGDVAAGADALGR